MKIMQQDPKCFMRSQMFRAKLLIAPLVCDWSLRHMAECVASETSVLGHLLLLVPPGPTHHTSSEMTYRGRYSSWAPCLNGTVSGFVQHEKIIQVCTFFQITKGAFLSYSTGLHGKKRTKWSWISSHSPSCNWSLKVLIRIRFMSSWQDEKSIDQITRSLGPNMWNGKVKSPFL